MSETVADLFAFFFHTSSPETFVLILATLTLVTLVVNAAIVDLFRTWFNWNGRLYHTVAAIVSFVILTFVWVLYATNTDVSFSRSFLSWIVLWALVYLAVLGVHTLYHRIKDK